MEDASNITIFTIYFFFCILKPVVYADLNILY